MKAGDDVRVTRPSSPLFGRVGRVVVVGPNATWFMVDTGAEVTRFEATDVTLDGAAGSDQMTKPVEGHGK